MILANFAFIQYFQCPTKMSNPLIKFYKNSKLKKINKEKKIFLIFIKIIILNLKLSQITQKFKKIAFNSVNYEFNS